MQITDAKYNYKCMAVHGEAKEGAKIVVEPCSGGPYQLFHYNEKKGQIRFNFEGDEFCVDALGGGSFGPGGDIGLNKCKRGDKNSEWSHTSEQAITLRSKFGGQTLCMNNDGKYVRGSTACSSESDEGLPWTAQWNFLPPGSTP